MNNYAVLAKWQELYTAALVELPIAATQLIFSGKSGQGVEAAAWRAYESWVWLANETANRFYSTGV